MLTPRHQLPRMIERGRAQTLSLPIFDGPTRITPVEVTLRLFDASGILRFGPTLATNLGSNDVALLAADTVDLDLDEHWLEEWSVYVTVTDIQTFRREAALVRRTLYPVITDLDLERVHPGLSAYLPSSQASWETQRDEAFDQLQARLLGKGNRPNLITGSWALRNVHLYWTLVLVADLLRVEASGRWAKLAEDWGGRVKAEWDSLTFQYDADDSGVPEPEDDAAVPPLFLCDVPGDWF